MIDFRMPALGADMEAGTLVEWLKKPGDAVVKGDIVAVVDTQKGAIEIEVFDDGVIDRTLVEPGATVPVGTLLATIRTPADATSLPLNVAGTAGPTPSAAPAAATASAPVQTGEPGTTTSATRPRVSPAARKRAGDLHVDLSRVDGRGPDGSVTVADVERVAAAQPGTPPARTAAMRTAIAAAMSRAKREIPHLYLSTTIDLTRALAWTAAQNQDRPVTDRLLPVVLAVKAVGRACVDVPALNGFWTEDGFAPGTAVHVGFAIALRSGGGLVAPALTDVDRKSTDTVARELADLVVRTRQGGLRSTELNAPTITLTNLGDLGAEAAYAIIHPPQVAIVAFGRIVERPWVVDGTVAVRSVVTVGLSADHRATDGREAGMFLAAMDRALQAPESL